jgi:hypothetical protein
MLRTLSDLNGRPPSFLNPAASSKPEYLLALARDGYVLVRCELAVFKPEARGFLSRCTRRTGPTTLGCALLGRFCGGTGNRRTRTRCSSGCVAADWNTS